MGTVQEELRLVVVEVLDHEGIRDVTRRAILTVELIRVRIIDRVTAGARRVVRATGYEPVVELRELEGLSNMAVRAGLARVHVLMRVIGGVAIGARFVW